MVMVVDVGEPVPKAGRLVAPNSTVKVWSPSKSLSLSILTLIQAGETGPIPKLNISTLAVKSVPSTEKQDTIQSNINMSLHACI